MGTFRVTVGIGDPQAQHFEEVEALVATGATYTVAPRSLLRRLGVEPHIRAPFVLADERQVEYDIGRTWVQVDGQTEMVLVVFGNEGAEPLLGAFTLEAFRLAPDPISRRLIPIPWLLKEASARPMTLRYLPRVVVAGPPEGGHSGKQPLFCPSLRGAYQEYQRCA